LYDSLYVYSNSSCTQVFLGAEKDSDGILELLCPVVHFSIE